MKALIVLPILVPMVTAALMLLAYRRAMEQRLLSLIGSLLQLGIAISLLVSVHQNGIVAVQMGGWKAPFGISLVADMMAVLLVVLSGIIAVVTSIYSLADIDRERRVYGFYPLMQILLMGVNGAFLTGDIFNLYVWFEVMLIASFVLLVLGNERRQMEGAIKYLTLNLIASAIFLAAVGILYGSVHALNLADLSLKLQDPAVPTPMINTLAVLFLVAFGIKAAVFPLFFWMPDSYHTPPTTVTRALCRAAHQGGRVFHVSRLHHAVRGPRRLHLHADPDHCRFYDGGRRAWGTGSDRDSQNACL